MGRRSRGWALSPVTALLLGVAFALVGNMATNTVDQPDSWRWWPWAVWAAVVLLVAGSVWVQRKQLRSPDMVADERILEDLAARIERDWSAEAVRREVTHPAPLLVSWSSTGRPAASRAAVLGHSPDADWQQFPLRGETDVPQRGQPEGINQRIVAAYRKLPRRQLMILGKPGAGKSVFVLLLTIGLIRTREVAGEALPVLLQINAWNPDEPVDAFVASRLAEDYEGVLARYGSPQLVAERLVEHQRILPVLDGLDELPSRAAVRAFKALDSYAATGRPLVVTCRTQEYEEAVQLGQTVLTTTAVVELQPVTIDAAVAYLSFPESVRPRWDSAAATPCRNWRCCSPGKADRRRRSARCGPAAMPVTHTAADGWRTCSPLRAASTRRPTSYGLNQTPATGTPPGSWTCSSPSTTAPTSYKPVPTRATGKRPGALPRGSSNETNWRRRSQPCGRALGEDAE